METSDILMMLKGLSTTPDILPTLTVKVTNGISEESHTLNTVDSVVDLLFDLSMYGGMIIDFSYNIRFHKSFGILLLDLDIRILKTMQGRTNIDADIIEELSRIINRGEKNENQICICKQRQ